MEEGVNKRTEQWHLLSTLFSKHQEVKVCFLWGKIPTGITTGERHPLSSQHLGSRDPDRESEAGAVGEGAVAAPGLCPAATLGSEPGPVIVPPGCHGSISNCSALLSPALLLPGQSGQWALLL